MARETIFIARQPILDLKGEIFGYELLFRGTESRVANISDHAMASAKVIFDTISNFGVEKMVGPHKAFINLNSDLLMSDTLEILPPKHFVLELLETIDITTAVIERCRELKLKGFSIALDDNLVRQTYLPLYEFVDIVKIDVIGMSAEKLSRMATMLKRWPIVLLAEKVETSRQQAFCKELGFQLFQGFFFAEPTLLRQNRIDSSKGALMQLLNQVLSDSDVADIERTFKHNADLTYKLLKLVNSVMFGLREKITTIRQAITTVGMQQLKRWVLMALFSMRNAEIPQSPLLEMASARGRLMERVTELLPASGEESESPDLAFLAGLLSLLDVQLGISTEELVEQLNLGDRLRQALLDRSGRLGLLLALCECLERDNSGGVAELLIRLGLPEDDLFRIQLEVIDWTNIICNME